MPNAALPFTSTYRIAALPCIRCGSLERFLFKDRCVGCVVHCNIVNAVDLVPYADTAPVYDNPSDEPPRAA